MTQKMLKLTVFLLTVTSFALPLKTTAQTARIQSIAGRGKVRVQRERRTDWIPVRQGIELYQGDQILPDKGVTVYVRCPDFKEPTPVAAGVPSGLGSICISWPAQDARGSQAVGILGGVDPSIPYLITPRHSLLLSPTPLLRWNRVSDATEYFLEVRSPTSLMWTAKTKENQIIYAGKPLAAGVPYSLSVRTDTGKSSRDDGAPGQQKAPNLEFIILRPSEAALIRAEAAKISPNPLNNEADALTLANLYGNYILPASALPSYQLPGSTFETYSLTGDAIAILESLLREGKQSPLIHRTLGSLYWQTGLITLAEAHYLKAIDSVQGLEDLEDWTIAQHSLGQLYAAIDDPEQALQHYSQARAGYIFLGDPPLAESLRRRIEKLKNERRL